MIWTDEGYLVKLINYSENSIIANFFTNNHGYYSGIIYGGNSKKYKNKLQIGNKLHLHYKSKTEDSLGYFNCELLTSNGLGAEDIDFWWSGKENVDPWRSADRKC